VNLADNPFLCDALRARKMLPMRTQSLMQEDCLLQSNRLRVFYRGVNYSDVMILQIAYFADFAYNNESYSSVDELI